MTDAPFVVEEERVKFRQRQAKNATRRYKQQMAELRDLLTATDDAVDSSAARTNLISAAAKLSQLQTTLATTSVERESDDARQLFKLALAHGDAGDTWRPSIIYCDPPWAYGNPSHVLGTKHHYDTMSDDALAALPVAALAGEDCALLMWATLPKLASALRVMAAWGFEYKTVFTVWIKLEKYLGRLVQTCGSYTSPNAEIVLIGTRGQLRTSLRRSFRAPNVLMTRPTSHSRKPELLRTMAVELFGDLPRIELFGRTDSPDWVVWGNEAPTAHRVDSVAESDQLTAEPMQRRYDMEGGAEENVARRRRRPATGSTKQPTGPQPASLANYLERFEPATQLAKSDYRLLLPRYEAAADATHCYDSDLHQAVAKRARFADAIELDVETPPLYESVSRADLQGMGFIDSKEKRSATYPTLSVEQVRQNIDAVQRHQRRNADLLFAFNRNKRKRSIVCSVPPSQTSAHQ